MNKPMRRIGVLTSGGDAPGMNACIRAVYRACSYYGVETYGIRRGYTGLIERDISLLSRSDVANIIHLGGTVLGTSRSERFMTPEGRMEASDVLMDKDIDGLVLIGGDGTFRGGLLFFQETGIPVIGVPGTIDNDVMGTDFSIGFDTAVNVALDSIDRIRDTAISHGRLFFVEVMGHTSGFIAIESGIGGGAEYLVMPDNQDIVGPLSEYLLKAFASGKHHAIVVVAEGSSPGCSFKMAKEISERINIDARVCVLGHTQRGGSPTARDRVLAAKLGVSAVLGLIEGKSGVMAGEMKHDIAYTTFEQVVSGKNIPDPRMDTLINILSG